MTVTLDRNVEAFIGAPRQLFIDGQWTAAASGKTFDTPNPATGETLARIAEGDAEDINRAVRAARRAFEDGPWSRMTPSERGRIIWRIGDLILEHTDELAQLESLDNGKPFAVAQAADVPLAADLFHYMAGWATKIEGNTINISVPYMPGANFHSYTLREPLGVVGQIIPWNFPLLMAAWKLGPALATGNCVVLKPAEQTPLTALRLAELIAEAGVPDGVVNVVHRVRRDGRRGAGRAQRCRQGGLHRLHRGGQADRRGEYGLGAGIWTRDISKAHALAKKIRAGTIWINCYNVFDAALPLGGYKQSGWGREMGHQALRPTPGQGGHRPLRLIRRGHDDVGRLDHGDHLGALGQAELADRLHRDRGDQPHAVGVQFHVGDGLPRVDAGHPGRDLIARAQLHSLAPHDLVCLPGPR